MDRIYSENCIKFICYKVLSGLKFLHERNVIHRDIKSDNVLFNCQGEVVIADFGAAVKLTKEVSKRARKVGSLQWMAPEIIRGDRKYTEKMDIWSFGILAYELAEIDLPLETQEVVNWNTLTNDLPEINELWSQEFRDFVKKCLNRNSSERPTTDELLDDPFLKDAQSHKAEFATTVTRYIEENGR